MATTMLVEMLGFTLLPTLFEVLLTCIVLLTSFGGWQYSLVTFVTIAAYVCNFSLSKYYFCYYFVSNQTLVPFFYHPCNSWSCMSPSLHTYVFTFSVTFAFVCITFVTIISGISSLLIMILFDDLSSVTDSFSSSLIADVHAAGDRVAHKVPPRDERERQRVQQQRA